MLIAHVAILGLAWLIISAFGVAKGLPKVFLIGEVTIIVTCGLITVRIPGFAAFLRQSPEVAPGAQGQATLPGADGELEGAEDGTHGNDGERGQAAEVEDNACEEGEPGEGEHHPLEEDDGAEGAVVSAQENNVDPKEPESKAEALGSYALIGAFIVQFAVLIPLLTATGGPIDSPFAEMTLAIAVFTPFVANNPITMVSVFAASIVYYALLILIYGSSHPGKSTRVGHTTYYAYVHAPVWAYFWVNIMILTGAVGLTLIELLARRRIRTSQPAVAMLVGADGPISPDGLRSF